MAAAAEGHRSSSRQTKGFPLRIEDLDVALNAQRAIVVHGDLGARHFLLRLKTCARLSTTLCPNTSAPRDPLHPTTPGFRPSSSRFFGSRLAQKLHGFRRAFPAAAVRHDF